MAAPRHIRPTTFYRSLIAALIACCALAPTSHAEFLKTGPFLYQSTNGTRLSVIAVPPGAGNVAGIFIALGPKTPIQLFSLEALKRDSSKSVFLRFSPDKNSFTEALIEEASFEIRGSFTLRLDNVRITVDTNNTNPYCTIVYSEPEEEPAILGFVGTSEVFNIAGSKAVKILEPDLSRLYKGMVADYQIGSDRKLLLEDKVVSIKHIGVSLELNNPCLQQTALVLDDRASEQLREARRNKQTSRYRDILAKTSSADNLFNDLLVLRVTKKRVIAYRYETEAITMIETTNMTYRGSRLCFTTNFSSDKLSPETQGT